jgi:hypothetical protein
MFVIIRSLQKLRSFVFERRSGLIDLFTASASFLTFDVLKDVLTMLVDERDTADVNGDDRLLKRVENALRLLDNSILVPPKLYNFKLTKM